MKILIVKDLYEANTIWGCVSYDDNKYSDNDIKNEIFGIIQELKAVDEACDWQLNNLAREFNKRHCFTDACFTTNVSCVGVSYVFRWGIIFGHMEEVGTWRSFW